MLRTITLFIAATSAAAYAQPAEQAEAHARADAPSWRFDMGSSTRWFRDPSAIIATNDQLASFVMSAEHGLGTVELPRGFALELGVDAMWANGSAAGSMFQTLETSIGTNDLLGGVHASVRALRILAVTARAQAGASHVDLSIAPSGQPQMASVDDGGWARTLAGSVGAEIEPIAMPQVRLGFGMELGYLATSGVEMHASPTNAPDPDRSIETAYQSIGHLDLDGWTLRISAHLGF